MLSGALRVVTYHSGRGSERMLSSLDPPRHWEVALFLLSGPQEHMLGRFIPGNADILPASTPNVAHHVWCPCCKKSRGTQRSGWKLDMGSVDLKSTTPLMTMTMMCWKMGVVSTVLITTTGPA